MRSVHKTADDFTYSPYAPTQVACQSFSSAEELARMVDYARRNWSNCTVPGGRECHTGYHFTDVAIQRDAYRLGLIGTEPTDVAQAISAF